MKNHLTIILLMICAFCQAQAPLRINFQGVVRTADGNLVVSESLVLEIGFKANLSSPVFLYRESHNTQTNAYGQVSVQIGNGTILNGTFNTIDWSTGTVTFEAVASVNGSNLVLSQQQLSSVPYALFATKAQSLSGPDDIDNTNEIQSLNLTGNTLGISGHPGTVNLSSLLDNTDNQTLSFANNSLSITGGNSVNLSSLINDADADPGNEIQSLNLTGNTLGISGHPGTVNLSSFLDNTDNQTLSFSNNNLSIAGGNSVNLSSLIDADADPVNEIQSLNFAGNILGISGHPGTVNLSSLLDNTDNQTLSFINNNLSIAGGNSVNLSSLINDADADPANELQTLNFSNTTLSISGGNSVNLTTLLNDADADPVNEIQHLSLSGSTLQLSQSGNTVNLGPFTGTNTDEQTLSIVNNNLTITNGNAVDLSPYLQNAGQVPYNNATSGLSATTAQTALDEIAAEKPDNLQEAYSGGSTVQLNGSNEFRIRNNTAGPILSTSNTVSGLGVGVETPQHKLHVEGTTLLTVHPGFDAFET
ncbi:MAG: hypothetical protein EBR30_29040, partial [Cytophagia bacterium]|nr:hypothetical protein [Cytophagia bacterium]